MGVIYKLKDEVVHFIISQRQSNPLFSCRQLAESASQKFDLQLSKSSVHDVLKEAGIITPRGRKPKDRFKIPQEKKKQIQYSLSQVKLLPDLVPNFNDPITVTSNNSVILNPDNSVEKEKIETPSEYEGAGKIFLKAALWDLGIFSQESIKETDWPYYLTYAKGIKVVLENDKNFFIDMPLPLERCIREAADGLINNTRPFVVDKVSDQGLFKACMDANEGFKIKLIDIVGQNDHILLEFNNIMEQIREFIINNRIFVENLEKEQIERARAVFFSQNIDNKYLIDNIWPIKGFDVINKDEFVVNLLINKDFSNKPMLQDACERLNGMCLYDDQGRLIKIKIQG